LITIILGVIGTAAALIILPGILAPFANSSNPGVRMAVKMTIPFSVLGALVGFIYPVFVLIFMRKPHVVAAFENQPGGQIP
jgi:hypothetical protein